MTLGFDWTAAAAPGTSGALRLGLFLAVLLALLAAESRWPRRRDVARRGRWLPNLSLVAIDALAVRLLLPLGAVGAALWARERGFGAFEVAGLPPVAAFVLGFAALDLTVWIQHWAMHRVPALWRLHRVHHSDLGFDATTALRFHPAEILLSMALKMAVVAALGVPPAAVVAFEGVLNACAMFNHANLRLPGDSWLRRVLVTPDMHRVHHSVRREEQDSNYGFTVPWWDRLFRTYRAQPRSGHEAMPLGVERFREAAAHRLGPLLLQPFAPGGRTAGRP